MKALSRKSLLAFFALRRPLNRLRVKQSLSLTTRTMSSESSANNQVKSKALSPPSIADREAHERILGRYREECGLNLAPEELNVDTMPFVLQEYVLNHSLRRTTAELELQKALNDMPHAVMAGAPEEANFLCLLLELLDAHTVVEVGVFRGSTTLCLAKCLAKLQQNDDNDNNPTKRRRVIGLDVSQEFAQVGMEHWKQAGVQDFIDFRVGDAKDTLSQLLSQDELGPNSVDLCFIDADKTSYDDYYEKCLQLTRPGGLVVVDNTIWFGNVAIPDTILQQALHQALDDKNAVLEEKLRDSIAIKALNDKIHQDDRIERVCFLTIADGVTICRKK